MSSDTHEHSSCARGGYGSRLSQTSLLLGHVLHRPAAPLSQYIQGSWPCLDAMVVLTLGILGTKGVELAFGHLL